VERTFTIDPTVVAASITPWATSYDYEGHTCFASGRYWVFYLDGSRYGIRSSADGITWSAETTLTTSTPANGNGMISWYCKGNEVYYAGGSGGANDQFFYRYGILNPDGTVTWAAPEGAVYTWGSYDLLSSIAVDSRGDIWVAMDTSYNLRAHIEVWEHTTSWAKTLDITGASDAQLVPLTSGKVALLYANNGISFHIMTYNGAYWMGANVATAPYDFRYLSASSIGDTVELAAFDGSSHIVYQSYAFGASSWSPSTVIGQGTEATISSDGSGTLVIFWTDGGSNVRFAVSTTAGSSWGPVQSVSSTETSANYPSASFIIVSNMAEVVWTSGNSAPYDVRFAALPTTVQDAVTSKSSWSRPGLSPYESYFAGASDYISPGNGLLAIEQGTLGLPGRGLDLGLGLVYSTPYAFWASSLSSPYRYDNYTGANLGYGWSLNLPWLGTNYLHLADGQAYPYDWSGNTFTYHGAVDFQLVQNSGGTYTLYDKSGTDYQFNSNKQLASITDQTGNNTITFAYGANGYISQVTDTVGRTATLSYSPNGQLSSVSSAGRTWTFAYSGSNLVSVSDPLGRATTYQYDTGINDWLISGVLYPTGGKATSSYGSAPVGTEMKTYYVTSRNVYSSATQLSQSTSISYGIVNGNVVWSNSTMSGGSGPVASMDNNFQISRGLSRVYDKNAAGVVTKITESDYDAKGRVNETKLLSPSGTILTDSTTSYDDWGNPVYTRDNVGQQAWFSYANTDSQNTFGSSGCMASFYTQTVPSSIHDLVVGQCDYQNGPGSPQQQTYYKYDSHGNLLEQKQSHNGSWLYADYAYDRYGNRISATDVLGRTTYYHYSPAYQNAYLTLTSSMVGSQNVTTSSTYDFATGLLLSRTNPDGQTTTYQYDILGRTTRIFYPAVGGISASKTYAYDDANNVLTTYDENGNEVKQFFDGLGRTTSVQAFNGTSVYSTTSYTYSWNDQVATTTTPSGSTYTYSYDQDGRQVKVTNPDGTTVTTSYDDVNNIKTVTDGNGHPTSYGYDWGGRLLWVRQYHSPAAYYQASYAYDLSGNLVTQTDPNGAVTSYQYDDLGRLMKTTFPDGTSELRSYDAVGNLASRTTPAGAVIDYSYDSLNRLTTVTYPDASTLAYTYDRAGNVLSTVTPSTSTYYTYDARNRVTNQTEVVGGVGYSMLYTYDYAGNIASMTYPDGYSLSFTYDSLNRVKQAGSLASFAYTFDSKLSKITYGNGQVATYSYDIRDRPTRILVKLGSAVALDLNYSYDSAGNVLRIDGQSYTYDWLNRLTSAQGPWLPISYSYDGAGNALNETVGMATTRYSYGPFNRLTSAGNVTFTYDQNGNTLTKVNGSTSWAYSYDYENRMTSVEKNGATVATNLYDGAGNLVRSTEADTLVYGYLGSNRIFSVNSNTGSKVDDFYANGLLVASRNGTSEFYQRDAIGSVRLVSDSTGKSTYSSEYRPFGLSWGTAGSSDFGFAGKPSDSTTGLSYFGARFYDPLIGRFVTEDSVSGAQTDSQSLNRYIYARDNPLAITDPTGHDWWSSFTNFVSNGASTVASDAMGEVSAVQNAWSSAPPSVKIGVVVAVSAVAIGVTLGADAPIVGIADAGAIGAIEAGGDVVATETASIVATTSAEAASEAGGSAVTALATNAVAGAGGGAIANVASDVISGRPINPTDILLSAGVGALGGAMSGGLASASVAPFSSTAAGFAKFAVTQAAAGIATEFANIAANTAVNHVAPPPALDAVTYGAGGGLAGGLLGTYAGPSLRGVIFSGVVTGIGFGITTGFLLRRGINFGPL
jgi:RHS repeat-associated protein